MRPSVKACWRCESGARGYLCFHANQALTKILWKKQMPYRNSLFLKIITTFWMLTSLPTKSGIMLILFVYVNVKLLYHCRTAERCFLPSPPLLTPRRHLPAYQDQFSTCLAKNNWPLKVTTHVVEFELKSKDKLIFQALFSSYSFGLLTTKK